MAQTKERIIAKAGANAKAKLEEQLKQEQQQAQKPLYSEEELFKLFSSEEKVERTPRGAKPQQNNTNNNNSGNKKKKKGKK